MASVLFFFHTRFVRWTRPLTWTLRSLATKCGRSSLTASPPPSGKWSSLPRRSQASGTCPSPTRSACWRLALSRYVGFWSSAAAVAISGVRPVVPGLTLWRSCSAGVGGSLRLSLWREGPHHHLSGWEEIQRRHSEGHGGRGPAQLHVWFQWEAHQPGPQWGGDEPLHSCGSGVCRWVVSYIYESMKKMESNWLPE